MDPLIGKTLGAYQVLARQGEGGMATVYKGYDPGTARNVALKVLSPLLAAEPGFQGRFDQEARTVARLEHPNILPIFQYGKQDQYSYIVMPFITSGTLADKIRQGPVNLAETLVIIRQLAAALDYAHGKEIIHRDLKPSNVLINKAGHCFLTDFGIAKLYQSTAHFTRTGGIVGTPSYMSPEQGQGGTVDRRSDVYSLGVILYECVTGRVPFEASTPIATVMQHISAPLPSPKLYNPHLADAVVLVIRKALAKAPDERFQSAGDLARTLEMALTQPAVIMNTLAGDAALTVVDAPPGMVPPAGSPPRPVDGGSTSTGAGRSKWFWLVGLLALLCITGGGVFVVSTALNNDMLAGLTGSDTPTAPPALYTPTAEPTPQPATEEVSFPPEMQSTETATPVTPSATPLTPTITATPTHTPTPQGPWGRIAFVSDRSGLDEIYVLDVRDPANRRPVTTAMSGGRDWWPDWCDENRIVFERADHPWQSEYQEIALVDISLGNVQTITSGGMPSGSTFNGLPSCSHDGQRLAFSTFSSDQKINWAIGTINLNDASPHFVTISSDGYALGGNVSWSPDDRSITFMHYNREEKNYHVYRVDLDDPYDYMDLSGSYGGNNKYPVWSPDGQWIAFSCGKTYGDDRRWSLCLTPSDYSEVRVVLQDMHIGPERWSEKQLVRHAITPNWSPDGQWIAFASNRDGDFDIYIYSLVDDELINLTGDWAGDEMHPSWGR